MVPYRKSITSAWMVLISLCWMPNSMFADPALRVLRYQSQPAADASAWQTSVRGKMSDLLQMTDLVARSAVMPFDPKLVSTTNKDGYVVHELEINATENRRMALVLTVPTDREGPFPALVLTAGHGSTRHTCYEEGHGYHRVGHVLAQHGFVTISTAISRHKALESGRTLVGERLWDLMRCVDYLESRPEVDAQRIGSAGKSLGGEMSMWLAAMDQRIRAAVVTGFLTDMNQMEKDHCMCWKLPGLRELVDFPDLFSLIAPRPLLCQNGLDEPASQFPPSKAVQVLREIGVSYADHGVPANVTLVVHKGGHEFHVPSTLSFFQQHLPTR